ncbi:MAG: branched-chain amino acid ABC transporter permease [Gammaproteobacteria bacterium]|nr:branched-chain amino acid ABC transporter permease [Gammaproteobacteria bacterium]
MDIFSQQLINGLVLGSIYALIALGYTMVYGILGLINFAHGEITMFGAMVSLAILHALLLHTGLPTAMIFALALLGAIGFCMALGFSIERVAYRPLRNAPRLAPLITAIGMSIVLQNTAMLIWGKKFLSFPDIIPIQRYQIAGANITNLQVAIIVLAIVLMLGLWTLIQRSRLGRAMRATAQSPELAALMGINPNRIISATFMLGAALAAIAGIMVNAYYGPAHYTMGFMLGLKAFTAAVLGGIGNIAGAMLGGLVLGLIESFGAGYISQLSGGFMGSNYQSVFAFTVLIIILVFRPSGLLGERVGERV